MDIKKLSAFFAPKDIEWRAQQVGFTKDGKPWAMVLAYITNRAIMARLDEVVGPMNWCNEFRVDSDNAISCGISIYDAEKNRWVTKWDAAEATDIEAIKGGRSSAMKRAGVQWGIGRYLYQLDTTFAECRIERPSAQEKHEWTQAKSEGKVLYWRTPSLPAWCTPVVTNKHSTLPE